jgi:hypothetical protein
MAVLTTAAFVSKWNLIGISGFLKSSSMTRKPENAINNTKEQPYS